MRLLNSDGTTTKLRVGTWIFLALGALLLVSMTSCGGGGRDNPRPDDGASTQTTVSYDNDTTEARVVPGEFIFDASANVIGEQQPEYSFELLTPGADVTDLEIDSQKGILTGCVGENFQGPAIVRVDAKASNSASLTVTLTLPSGIELASATFFFFF